MYPINVPKEKLILLNRKEYRRNDTLCVSSHSGDLACLCIGIRCSVVVAECVLIKEGDFTGMHPVNLFMWISFLGSPGKRVAPLARAHAYFHATLISLSWQCNPCFGGFLAAFTMHCKLIYTDDRYVKFLPLALGALIHPIHLSVASLMPSEFSSRIISFLLLIKKRTILGDLLDSIWFLM